MNSSQSTPPKRRATRVAGRAGTAAVDDAPLTPSPVPRNEPAEPPAAEAADAAEPTPAAAEGRSLKPLVVGLSVATAVMTAIALVLAAVLVFGADDGERREALDKAREYGQSFLSFKYDALDDHESRVKSFGTEKLNRDYKSLMALVSAAIVEGKGESEGTVHNAGLSEMTDDEAVAVLIVDQTVKTNNLPQPRIDRNRMVMRMVKVDGDWKVAKFELL